MANAQPIPLFDVQIGNGTVGEYRLWSQLLLGNNRAWARRQLDLTFRFSRSTGVVNLRSPRGFRVHDETFARARVTVRIVGDHDDAIEVTKIEGLD